MMRAIRERLHQTPQALAPTVQGLTGTEALPVRAIRLWQPQSKESVPARWQAGTKPPINAAIIREASASGEHRLVVLPWIAEFPAARRSRWAGMCPRWRIWTQEARSGGASFGLRR